MQVFKFSIRFIPIPRSTSTTFSGSNRLYCKTISNDVDAQAPLVDEYGRKHDYLRISLTERCNLRCQYCMPAGGVPLSPRGALCSREELARLVRVFAALGVTKLRLTGGEPTLRKDLPELIQELAGIEGIKRVSMTTNGVVLTRRLPALQRAGLGALNVSLDSLRADRYEAMARRPGLAKVLAGVDLALQLGYSPVKINTVLVKGFNDDEICDFVEYTRDRDVEVRFIEFMPFSGNEWDASRLVPHRTALRRVAERYELQPQPPRPNDTAVVWRAAGHAGSVGFISSMTQHFCASCNRLRLTADGNLKVCLFGSAEVSLLGALRGGAGGRELAALVRAALRNKKPSHAARRGGAARARPRQYRTVPHARHPGLQHARQYCTLSHLDAEGRARMVDVGDKPETQRTAAAECHVEMSAALLALLRDRRLPKGDALCVAETAGVQAAKRTADLIPLCHPLPLSSVRVRVSLPAGAGAGRARVRCDVALRGRTGAEMEALTGAAVAALALYDMCKAADRRMRVTDLRVVSKTGGKHDWSE